MVPTVPHILMTAHGGMPGGELWSCGLRTYHTTSFLSPTSGHALAVAVAERWMTFRNSVGAGYKLFASHATNAATVTGVTVRELDINGLTVSQYEGVPVAVNGAGGAQAATAPNQAALAVTLLTARAGRTGKGRIYLPCLNTAPEAGVIIPATITTIVTGVKTLLDGINTDLATNFGSTLRLAVQSPKAAKEVFDDNSLADYNGAEITGFKVGCVIDTQRRRRSSLIEVYAQAALA